MGDDIVIAGRQVGPGVPPFVVAELSGNHNGVLERALALVDAAAESGADALKLQTYTADTLTVDVAAGDFLIADGPWAGRSLYDLYSEAALPWEWHEPIMRRASERGLVCFSTPFDESSLEFLERLGMPCYKIASFELVHLPLIRAVASTGKPMILSTGMATAEEIGDAVEAARESGCDRIVLLKCTSAYPAEPSDTDLLTIPDMRERFGCQVGLSDHTLGIGVAVAAVALGVTLVEKHLTLARADGGPDSGFSAEPAELAALVDESRRAWRALGAIRYGPTDNEQASLRFRRSLYVVEDMRAGDVLTSVNLRIVRPGFGLAPRYHDVLLGKRVQRDTPMGTPVTWDLLG